MKKKSILLVLVFLLMFTACGQKQIPEQTFEDILETTKVTESIAEISNTDTFPEPSKGIDNFSVDKNKIIEFAMQIQNAVLEKDIEKLSLLSAYPVYIGFLDEGLIIETREDFLALDTEKLFSNEMIASIQETQVDSLQPSMAGFIMMKDSKEHVPNIIFGIVDEALAITGINY